jgi:epoxyqueuosine reductase QueG
LNSDDDIQSHTQAIIEFFNVQLNTEGERGDIGFAKFDSVYDNLMPVQQGKLRSITSDRFEDYYNTGSMVSIGVSYTDPIIDYINADENDEIKYKTWNKYALEYDRLNQILNRIAKRIAAEYEGIALTATIGGMNDVNINHVHDYFEKVVSHRVVAEQAGLGWRGKNQLLIHEKYSCAIRFASIILSKPVIHGKSIDSLCGECSACEDACSYIRYREILPDYRENCRRYILHLKRKGIEKDVCGKCIKACYRNSILKDTFVLSE